jgi:hypothetical protein
VNRRLAYLVAATDLALLLFLSGCAGSPTASVPGSIPASAPALRSAERARVRFTIKVPAERRHRGARYISPATQSITLALSRSGKIAVSKVINLTPNSPGCSVSLQSTICTVEFGMPSGSGYIAAITAYDAPKGTGKVLSTGQSLALNVKQGKLNSIPLTLNGVPASILVKQADSSTILVTALDGDGNFIIGPGAPAFTASRTAGADVATFVQPSATSPNKIGVSLVSSPPAPPATETIGITASYPAGTANACVQPGAVCSLPAAASVRYQIDGTIFAGDYGNSAVKGFSTPIVGMGVQPTIVLSMPSPYVVGLGPGNTLFAMQYGTNGALYTSAPPYATIAAVNTGAVGDNADGGIAFNSTGAVFVNSTSANAVSEIAPPYTGAITSITSGVDDPYGVAFDSADNLYVANYGNSKLGVYANGAYATEKYTVSLTSPGYSATRFGSLLYVGEGSGVEVFSLPITSSAATPIVKITTGVNEAYSVALDAAGDLFVSNLGASTVTEYPAPLASGEAPSVTLTGGMSGPCNIVFDANGNLYVNNYSGGDIEEFDPPFTISSVPVGTTSTMSDPCFGALVPSSASAFTLSVP